MYATYKPVESSKLLERVVLFCDIRGQTKIICNAKNSRKLLTCAKVMESFFTKGEEIFCKAESKEFCGDEIMAIFNNVQVSIKCAFKAMSELLPLLERYGMGLGIGLHIDRLLYHNVNGGEFVLHVGKALNIAKRLEGLARSREIIISKDVYEQLEPSLKNRFRMYTRRRRLKDIPLEMKLLITKIECL